MGVVAIMSDYMSARRDRKAAMDKQGAVHKYMMYNILMNDAMARCATRLEKLGPGNRSFEELVEFVRDTPDEPQAPLLQHEGSPVKKHLSDASDAILPAALGTLLALLKDQDRVRHNASYYKRLRLAVAVASGWAGYVSLKAITRRWMYHANPKVGPLLWVSTLALASTAYGATGLVTNGRQSLDLIQLDSGFAQTCPAIAQTKPCIESPRCRALLDYDPQTWHFSRMYFSCMEQAEQRAKKQASDTQVYRHQPPPTPPPG